MALKPKKDARLTLRVTSTDKQDLKGAAARQDRSLNGLVQRIIEQWLSRNRRRRR